MSKLARFSPVQSKNEILNRAQAAIARVVETLLASRLLSDHQLLSVTYANGLNKYPHGLGRKTTGVLFSTSAGALTDSQASNPRTDKEVWITSTSAGSGTVLVF